MHYRRPREQGETFFFTVVTKDRTPILCQQAGILSLRNALRTVSRDLPFSLNAFVLLPDHVHCIWTMPLHDSDFRARWNEIRIRFAGSWTRAEKTGHSRFGKSAGDVWQTDLGEHRIIDDVDFVNRVEYIHYNPVKHGLVKKPVLWPHSTFHRYVERGVYLPDWGAGPGAPALPDICAE